MGVAIMLIGLAVAQYSSAQIKPVTKTGAESTTHASS
jgi:hypothetical protein